MIRVEDLHMHFGGIRAVDGVSVSIAKGSITGLIGPNGAGKSTLFNIVAGTIAPTAAGVDGEDVTGLRRTSCSARGMLRTFQIAHEFSNMTVLREPDDGAAGDQPGEASGDAWFRRGRVEPRETRGAREGADDVIEFLKLGHVRDELAGNLSGGQKKLLELGRTMMVDAKVVLPRRGRPPASTARCSDRSATHIVRLNRERGYTFFVIEHDMDLIGRLCDPVIVMADGKVLAVGTRAGGCRTRR